MQQAPAGGVQNEMSWMHRLQLLSLSKHIPLPVQDNAVQSSLGESK